MKANLTFDKFPVVKEAPQRKLALIEAEMSSNIQDFEQGILVDDQEFFEWWGLVQGAQKLEEKMKKSKRCKNLRVACSFSWGRVLFAAP